MRYGIYLATLITEMCIGIDVARVQGPPRKDDGLDLVVHHHFVLDDGIDNNEKNNGNTKLDHRAISVARRKVLSLLSLPDVSDYKTASKNRTLALMRLNVAAYPTCLTRIQHRRDCSYPEDTMSDIFKKRLSVFGPNIISIEDEIAATQRIDEVIWNESVVQSSTAYQTISVPQTTAEFEVGVQALEWTYNDTTILTFRGTFTDGDYANIENWMIDYALEKSTDRMKKAWIDDASLEWTAEMEGRSKVDDRWAKLAIRAGESYILGRNRPLKDGITRKESIMQQLVEAVAANETLSSAIGGLTVREAEAMGYWKLTKLIVDEVAKRVHSNNRTLILTGHSQGGTRAQFASMYLFQTTGIAHPTVTFAATGGACAARLMFDSNANLLDDLDPFIRHENMVEYVHPLDPWGNSMLGLDNGDQVCYWGKMDAQMGQNSSMDDRMNARVGAYHYCSKVYGWPGPDIIAAQAGLSGDDNLRQDFQRCRYYTHLAESILIGLDQNLNDDGTTDGGCYKLSAVAQNDPDQVCPTGRLSSEEREAVASMLLALLLSLLGCLLVMRCCRARCGSKITFSTLKHTVVSSSEDDPTNGWRDEESLSLELPEIA